MVTGLDLEGRDRRCRVTLTRHTQPHVVRDLNKVRYNEVVATVKALDRAKFVFEVFAAGRVQLDMVEREPVAPEPRVEPVAAMHNGSTHKRHLVRRRLAARHIEVGDTKHTHAWVKKFVDTVKYGVERRDHRNGVRARKQIHFAFVGKARQRKVFGILAQGLHILVTEAFEALTSHLEQRFT